MQALFKYHQQMMLLNWWTWVIRTAQSEQQPLMTVAADLTGVYPIYCLVFHNCFCDIFVIHYLTIDFFNIYLAVAWLYMFKEETWHLELSYADACIWLTWQEVRGSTNLRRRVIDWKRHSILTNLFQLWVMSLLLLLRKTNMSLTEIANSHNYSKIHLVSFKKLVCYIFDCCILF